MGKPLLAICLLNSPVPFCRNILLAEKPLPEKPAAFTLAIEKLKLLGIEKEALKSPNQLSGGEKQRVAIARALINEPLIVIGDEPTGNLDKKNGEIVFNVFKELAEVFNQSLLIVTHDGDFANRTHRIIEMEDGKIIKM